MPLCYQGHFEETGTDLVAATAASWIPRYTYQHEDRHVLRRTDPAESAGEAYVSI